MLQQEYDCLNKIGCNVVSEFELTSDLINEATKIIQEDQTKLSENRVKKLIEDSTRNWDLFYKNNQTNFFKDRKWLEREFPELKSSFISEENNKSELNINNINNRLIIDIGCGVGNSTIPLLLNNNKFNAICIDCSNRAIDLLKKRWFSIRNMNTEIEKKNSDLPYPSFPYIDGQDFYKNCTNSNNNILQITNSTPGTLLKAIVFDITKAEPFPTICDEAVADIVLLIFCLSSIDPKHHIDVAKRASRFLKPGGIVFFRDYGRYDMAQLRFASSNKSKIKDNFYVRYDGTFAYYFTLEDLSNLFSKSAGLIEIENKFCLRQFTNRKTNVKMPRIWIQAKFQKN